MFFANYEPMEYQFQNYNQPQYQMMPQIQFMNQNYNQAQIPFSNQVQNIFPEQMLNQNFGQPQVSLNMPNFSMPQLNVQNTTLPQNQIVKQQHQELFPNQNLPVTHKNEVPKKDNAKRFDNLDVVLNENFDIIQQTNKIKVFTNLEKDYKSKINILISSPTNALNHLKYAKSVLAMLPPPLSLESTNFNIISNSLEILW